MAEYLLPCSGALQHLVGRRSPDAYGCSNGRSRAGAVSIKAFRKRSFVNGFDKRICLGVQFQTDCVTICASANSAQAVRQSGPQQQGG